MENMVSLYLNLKYLGKLQKSVTLLLYGCTFIFTATFAEEQLFVAFCLYSYSIKPFQEPVYSLKADSGIDYFGFIDPLRNISVYVRQYPIQRRRKKRERNDSREKQNFKQPPSAPTASIVGPCPTIIQINRTPWH